MAVVRVLLRLLLRAHAEDRCEETLERVARERIPVMRVFACAFVCKAFSCFCVQLQRSGPGPLEPSARAHEHGLVYVYSCNCDSHS